MFKNSVLAIGLSAIAIFANTSASSVSAQQAQSTDLMFVLDASGSMWGQVDGKTKIEVARDVFSDLSKDWAGSSQAAGLIAYGHRRKGDCSDIELIAPVDEGSTAALGDIINGLVPRGKTPLSDAVRMAAEEMKFTEEAATVVLLTDGVETCNADPCALGAELERLGLNFTTHVIGFDIKSSAEKAQLQCLAAATGGKYMDSGDASELSDALQQVTTANTSEPETPSAHPLRITLEYADDTIRPWKVRFQARKPDTGEIRDLGTLENADEIIRGLAIELPAGPWLIEAISDEGQGTLEIQHDGERHIAIPFAAIQPDFQIQNGSPYQLGKTHNFYVTVSGGIQPGAQIPIMLVDPSGTRLDWETRFGSDGLGTTVHDFTSPSEAGTYRVVVGETDAPLAEIQIEYVATVMPEWKGNRSGPAGGELPVILTGTTYYYNTLVLSQNGTEVSRQQLGQNADPLKLPNQAGVYDLSYIYFDGADEKQHTSLGQVSVGGATVLPDDADAVAPPSGSNASTQIAFDGDTMKALDSDTHGWEPISPKATADSALLRDYNAEQIVMTCAQEICLFSDPETRTKHIPILGDFALVQPTLHKSGKVWIEMVNTFNGEWVTLNPIRQSDSVTDCVPFSAEGWHGTNSAADTDLICTVKGANGYTFSQMETLAAWASDRNAAAVQQDQADHNAAMGEDNAGTPVGPLQGNWIVTDMQSGAELMRWQLMQDDNSQSAFIDLAGLQGTPFQGVQGRFGDAPSISIVSVDADGRPDAMQINKPLSNGGLSGMLTRPGDWDETTDAYTGMLQLSGAQQTIAMIRIEREQATLPTNTEAASNTGNPIDAMTDALNGQGVEGLLSDEARDLMNGLNQIEGMDELLKGDGDIGAVFDMLSSPKAIEQLSKLGERANAYDEVTFSIAIPESGLGGLVEVFDQEGELAHAWRVITTGAQLVDLPDGQYQALLTASDNTVTKLTVKAMSE